MWRDHGRGPGGDVSRRADCGSEKAARPEPRMTIEQSDHFDGRRFFNPATAAAQPFSAVPRMLLEPRARWPAHIDEPAQRPLAREGAESIVTFIGHSTFLIQTPAGNILTDPMYSQRAGPLNLLAPRRS